MKVTVVSFEEKDFAALRAFMTPIWKKTYAFLPEDQVELLLDKYFSPEGIARYIGEGYEYFRILLDGAFAGVLVIVEREAEVYLDKLYLDEGARGQGVPAEIFDLLAKRGKDIALNVNRQNVPAVRCYLKNGFAVAEEQEIVLENGKINHDYRMVRASNIGKK